jgi:protease-4
MDLLNKHWALEARLARKFHIEISKNGISGLIAAANVNALVRKQAYLAEIQGSANANAGGSKTEDRRYVMVVPIMGVMTRYGDACSAGTEDIAAMLIQADKSERVAGILLEIESGGGEVNGISQLADAIAGIKKPKYAFVKGMAASAAYWAASAADKIIMEKGVVSEVGSIGVLMVHGELATHESRNGIKWTLIRADGSENKALLNPYEPINAAQIAAAKAEMKPMRDAFVKTIKKNRAGKLTDDETGIERVFSGEMFGAKEAIKLGLADEQASFEEAIKMVWNMRSV